MIFDIITKIISQIKNDPSLKNKVFPDSHIIDDLGLDSLDIIDFLLELEAEFNLQFDFEKIDFSIMQSMNALIAFIKAEQERCTVE